MWKLNQDNAMRPYRKMKTWLLQNRSRGKCEDSRGETELRDPGESLNKLAMYTAH